MHISVENLAVLWRSRPENAVQKGTAINDKKAFVLELVKALIRYKMIREIFSQIWLFTLKKKTFHVKQRRSETAELEFEALLLAIL